MSITSEPRAQTTGTLAERLAMEDAEEEAGRLTCDDRLTCHLHRRWLHHCVSSPAHVSRATRHRWCEQCRSVLTVAVDQLDRTVAMSCPECGNGRSPATGRMLVACWGSLAAEAGRWPTVLRAA